MALGAALRFWGITAGAPFRLANDEPFVVGTAINILKSGDLNPHFFDYGGLSIYLHTFVAACRFYVGAAAGHWSHVDEIWLGEFLTAARIVTAAMGAVTVYVVYRIGMRINPSVALVGAFAMAVLPPHVREAHFALTDTPLTLLTTLVLLLSLRVLEQPTARSVAVAGLVAGLAASVKYNGGLSLLMPMIAALSLARGRRVPGMAVAAVFALGGFLLTSPYTVIEFRTFVEAFLHLSSNYTAPSAFPDAAATYGKHLRGWFAWSDIAPLNVGFAGLAVSVAGAALIAVRRESSLSRLGVAILLIFPVAWFIMLCELGSLRYGRYLLPMAPMLCLGLAMAVVTGWRQSPMALRWGLRVMLLALLVLPVGAAISGVRDHARTRTSELAAAWLVHELRDDTIVIEAAAVSLPPFMKARHIPHAIDFTANEYRMQALQYVVTTDAETGRYFRRPFMHKRELAAFRDLLNEAEEVAAFLPSESTPGPGIRVLRIR